MDQLIGIMFDDPAWNASANSATVSIYAALNISAGISGQLVLAADSGRTLPKFDNQTVSETEAKHAPIYTEATSLRVAVLLAMAAASLIGNAATMWNIKRSCISRRVTRHSWSAVYFLIFHLAVADLLVTVFCIFGEAAWSFTVEWRAGVVACKALKFLQLFSLYLSTFVLVLIGVDRWIAVKYPWKSLHMMRRCYRLIGIAYVLAAVLSLPQVSCYAKLHLYIYLALFVQYKYEYIYLFSSQHIQYCLILLAFQYRSNSARKLTRKLNFANCSHSFVNLFILIIFYGFQQL